jgi:hypothetical protein
MALSPSKGHFKYSSQFPTLIKAPILFLPRHRISLKTCSHLWKIPNINASYTFASIWQNLHIEKLDQTKQGDILHCAVN